MTKKKEGPQGEVEELLAAAPETKAESDDMPELSPTSRELLEWSKEELDKQVQERTKEISQEIDDETNKALSQQPPSPAEADSNLSIKQEQNNEGLIALAASSKKQIQEAANALPAGDIKPKAKPTAEKKPIRKTEEVATEAVKSKINGKFNQLQRLYRENKDLISKENYDRIRNTGYFSTLKKFRAIEKNNDLTPMEKLTELNRLNKELDEGLDFYKNELPNWKLEKMTDNIKQISEDTKSKIKAIPKIKDIDVLSKQNKTEIIPDQPAVVEPTAIFDRQSENLLFPGRINLNEEEKQWLKDRAEFMAQTEKDSGFKDRRQGLTVDNISEPEGTAWSIENKRKFREEFNQKLQEWEKAHPKPQYPAEQPIITPVKEKYAAPKTSENRKTPSSPLTYEGTFADLLKNVPKDGQASPEPATENPVASGGTTEQSAIAPEPAPESPTIATVEQPQSQISNPREVERLLAEAKEENNNEDGNPPIGKAPAQLESIPPAEQPQKSEAYTGPITEAPELPEIPANSKRPTIKDWEDLLKDFSDLGDEEGESEEDEPADVTGLKDIQYMPSMYGREGQPAAAASPEPVSVPDELPPPPTAEEPQRHEAARRPATPPVASETTPPAAEPVVSETPLSTPVEQGARPSSEASSSARVPEAAPSPSPEMPAMPASRRAERPSGRTTEVRPTTPVLEEEPVLQEMPREIAEEAERAREAGRFASSREAFSRKEGFFKRKRESIKGIADRFMGNETNLIGRTISRIANSFDNRFIGKQDQKILNAEETVSGFNNEITAFQQLIAESRLTVNDRALPYKERSKAQKRIHKLEQKIRALENKKESIAEKMGRYEDLKEACHDRISERCRQVSEAAQDKLRPHLEQINDGRRIIASLQQEIDQQVGRRRDLEDRMLELERQYMNVPRNQRAAIKAVIDRTRKLYGDNEKLIKQGRQKIESCNDRLEHLNNLLRPWQNLQQAYQEAAKLPERANYQRVSAQDVIENRRRVRPEYSFEAIDENSEVDLADYVARFNEQLGLEGIRGTQELTIEDVKGHLGNNADRLTVGQIEVAINDLYRRDFDDDERESFLNAVRVSLAKETQEE